MIEPVKCGCGGEAKVQRCREVVYGDEMDTYLVYCERCQIAIPTQFTESKAIETWNKAMSERTAKVHDYFGCERCAECENPVFEDDEFCSGCGARLEWE